MFRRLCKAAHSGDDFSEECPAVYTAETVLEMIVQGKILDSTARGKLLSLAADEDGVRLPTETLLRAAALFLAEHGHPEVRDIVEDVVARLALDAVAA